MTQTPAKIVTILAARADEAREALAKLAKRGARYRQEISWTETARVEQRGTRRHLDLKTGKMVETPIMVDVIDLAIVGEAPRVGDFTLDAALERTPGGVMISAAPGTEKSMGKLGREWDGRCDHCGSTRARVHGFIVSKGRNRKVVGRSCLRDYLGCDAPDSLAARFAFLRDLGGLGDDEDSWGSWGASLNIVDDLLMTARACMKLWGWRPASFDGQTTAAQVWLRDRTVFPKGAEAEREQKRQLVAELKANRDTYADEAARIIDWARNLKPGRSDYLHNLQVALGADVVRAKHQNLVISAAAAWDKQVAREEERKAEAAKQAARPASDWVGTTGKRMDLDGLTLDRHIALPDRGYGESVLLKFVADSGAVISWITAYRPHIDGKAIERGQRFSARFTVKSHGEFQDVRETKVSRMVLTPEAAKIEEAA